LNRNFSIAQLEKYISIEVPRTVTKQICKKRDVSISQKKISSAFWDTKTNQKLNYFIKFGTGPEEIEQRKSLICDWGY